MRMGSHWQGKWHEVGIGRGEMWRMMGYGKYGGMEICRSVGLTVLLKDRMMDWGGGLHDAGVQICKSCTLG